MWDLADLSIELDYNMTDVAIVTINVGTPSGTLHIMASMQVVGGTLLLDGLHMHGLRSNTIGLANLMRSPAS